MRLDRAPEQVAPMLLGAVVRAHGVSIRLTEVEAYAGEADPGSHAFRGRTPRTEVMFGPAGRAYVYFTYGMHWCANVVCQREGVAHAVLLRALEPVAGIDHMRAARWGPNPRSEGRVRRVGNDRDLCRGPARLCQALGIDGTHDGADLITGDRGVWLASDGTPPPPDPTVTTRVGLSAGADLPWRWLVTGHPGVSRNRK